MTSRNKRDLESEIAKALDVLTVKQKVALVRGADFWSTTPIEEIGLRRMVLSDGPSGVRGPRWDERDPSLSLPCGTAMAASWNVELARAYGQICAEEARRKGVHVLLGPTINLHRSPRGGRHFECLSEDPWLTADMAVAYVEGVQSGGVAATPKHYVANDSETDRYTVDISVDERTLRELYHVPFEQTVKAGVWAMMSAYNGVNGVTMSESDLLIDPLESDWGFDGAMISDWTGVRSMRSATAGQDLAMPGPAPAWADMERAIEAGEVPIGALDRKVARLLRLAARVGRWDGADAVPASPTVDNPVKSVSKSGVELTRQFASAGMVLLKNDGILPLNAGQNMRIAVIGQNAIVGRFQGGGSATVLPENVVTPLEGIKSAFANADIQHRPGYTIEEGLVPFPLDWMRNPITGETGLTATFYDEEGAILQHDDRRAARLVWMNGDAPLAEAKTLRLHTILTPDVEGTVELGVGTTLDTRMIVDGEEIFACTPSRGDRQLGASFSFPPLETAMIDFAGSRDVIFEFDLQSSRGHFKDAIGITLGHVPEPVDTNRLIAEAVEAARVADVAIVVVGTNFRHEAEGRDRAQLKLPGCQDDLVDAVMAANPNTIVILNSGAPVELPWRNHARAILVSWFGGQELGSAIGDILSGICEPGGRLPTTWPTTLEETPVSEVVPVNGVLRYEEGIHIGYKAFLRSAIEPAYPFGFGLGYTSWELQEFHIASVERNRLSASIRLKNSGTRRGAQIVQIYAEKSQSSVERPLRWLVGFARVEAEPGESVNADLCIDLRRLAYFDHGWKFEHGDYCFFAGFSVVDLILRETVTL